MKTFNSLERSDSCSREGLVKQDYLSSSFFMSMWVVFLLSGPALGYAVVRPLILLHRCSHPVLSCD